MKAGCMHSSPGFPEAMVEAFVAVGSNIDPGRNVRAALEMLSAKEHVTAISNVYRTAPEGRAEQGDYFNCVVEIWTSRAPIDLKRQVLRPIEAVLGRERSSDRFAARTIDLDLILYDEITIETPELTLPDPALLNRPFVALPILELAPDLVVPGSSLALKNLVAGLSHSGLELVRDYSEELKEMIRTAKSTGPQVDVPK